MAFAELDQLEKDRPSLTKLSFGLGSSLGSRRAGGSSGLHRIIPSSMWYPRAISHSFLNLENLT